MPLAHFAPVANSLEHDWNVAPNFDRAARASHARSPSGRRSSGRRQSATSSPLLARPERPAVDGQRRRVVAGSPPKVAA